MDSALTKAIAGDERAPYRVDGIALPRGTTGFLGDGSLFVQSNLTTDDRSHQRSLHHDPGISQDLEA